MSKIEAFVTDQVRSGQEVLLVATLYSTKKHHGGKARRGLQAKTNAASAKKLTHILDGSFDLESLLDEETSKKFEEGNSGKSKDNSSENLSGSHEKKIHKKEKKDALDYGHSGSVNAFEVCKGYLKVDDGKLLINDKVYFQCINALNFMSHRRLHNTDGFNLQAEIERYDAAKQSIIQKYAVRGVVPAENQLAMNKELANISFIYYRHQIEVKVFSSESLNELSRWSSELECYVTSIASVAVFSRGLISSQVRTDLHTSETVKYKVPKEQFVKILVTVNPETHRYELHNSGETQKIPIRAKFALDDYT